MLVGAIIKGGINIDIIETATKEPSPAWTSATLICVLAETQWWGRGVRKLHGVKKGKASGLP